LVDSIVLMAVLQRHFLPRPRPGWDDAALARDLGLEGDDLARAQRALDGVLRLPLRGSRPAPSGRPWWRAHTES
jgi:hypothetical protein